MTTGKANIWLKWSKAGDFLEDMGCGQNLWLSGKHIGKMSVPYRLHGFVTIFMAWFLGIVVFVSPLSFCIYMNVNEGTSYYDETIFYFYSTYTPSLHPKNSTFLTFSTLNWFFVLHFARMPLNIYQKLWLEDVGRLGIAWNLLFFAFLPWDSSPFDRNSLGKFKRIYLIYLSIYIYNYIFNQPSKKKTQGSSLTKTCHLFWEIPCCVHTVSCKSCSPRTWGVNFTSEFGKRTQIPKSLESKPSQCFGKWYGCGDLKYVALIQYMVV